MFKTFIFLKVHLHSTAYFIIEKDYREPPFRAKSPFFAWNWELLEFVISWKLTKLPPILFTHLHSEFSVNLQIGGLWIRHLKKISRFSVSHFLSDPGWFALHEIEPLYIVDNFENVQGCFWCWCWCCYTWSRSFANISILKFDANFETEVKTFWTSRIGWRVSQIFQVTWVHERLPRTSLAWWDGVGSRYLMKLVHNSNILIYHEYPLDINQETLLWIWEQLQKNGLVTRSNLLNLSLKTETRCWTFLNWFCFLETTRCRENQARRWGRTCPTCTGYYDIDDYRGHRDNDNYDCTRPS